jgi:hypothetical protein
LRGWGGKGEGGVGGKGGGGGRGEKWTKPCMHIWIIKEKEKKTNEACDLAQCDTVFVLHARGPGFNPQHWNNNKNDNNKDRQIKSKDINSHYPTQYSQHSSWLPGYKSPSLPFIKSEVPMFH